MQESFSDYESDSTDGVSELEFPPSDDDSSMRVVKKNDNYLTDVVPCYDDTTFITHFRVSRRIVEGLAARYEGSPLFTYQAGLHGRLEAEDQVLIFLWYAGHQTASFRDVADRFGISLSTLHKFVHRVAKMISNLSPTVIVWPDTQRMLEINDAFEANGFPGAVGAVDGTHIRIDKPDDDPDSYINKKGYYSIQVQAVCDHERKIIDLFLGYPGSVHDARVFNVSPLATTIQEKCGNGYILADSAYACLQNVITPYLDRGALTEMQKRFNIGHAENRYVIEHCFGLLKQKFRQLYHLKLRHPEDIAHFIRACCVLHNLALIDDFMEEVSEVEEDDTTENEQLPANEDNRTGQEVRDRLARRF